MTRFKDGPAKGQLLMLNRSPIFLRVVEKDGKWDALDQWEDSPRPGESIHVYQRVGEAGTCHIYARGGGGGFFSAGDYEHVAEQPSDEDVRNTAKWQAWCRAKKSQ
jgi:hypothetical protein